MHQVSKTKLGYEIERTGPTNSGNETSISESRPGWFLETPWEPLDKAVSRQLCLECPKTGLESIEIDHLVKIRTLFELQKHVQSMWSCLARPLRVCLWVGGKLSHTALIKAGHTWTHPSPSASPPFTHLLGVGTLPKPYPWLCICVGLCKSYPGLLQANDFEWLLTPGSRGSGGLPSENWRVMGRGAAQDELTISGLNKTRFPHMHSTSQPAHDKRKGKGRNQTSVQLQPVHCKLYPVFYC